MAVATKNRNTTVGKKQPRQKGLSDTQRWIYGIVLLAVALFILLSVVSYFIYWSKDQSIAHWGQVFSTAEETAKNWGGKLGAVTADYIVGKWFGVFGVCIPIVLIILSLRIMRYRPMRLNKSVRLMLVLMILGSVALGYLFDDWKGIFGSGLGGEGGIYAAQWLKSLLGTFGTGVLLLAAFIIYAVYINRNTIGVINRLGKGVVDNSKKLGEVISSTASDLLPQTSRKEEDESQNTTAETPVPAPDSSRASSGGHSTVIVDEDGFSVVIPSGSASDGEGEEFHNQGPRVVEQVDESGFVIVKPIEELDPAEPPEQPLPTDKENPGVFERVDENGFTIQYTPGDGFVAAVPQDAGIDGSPGVMTVTHLPEDRALSEEEIDNALYDPTLDLSSYQRPPIELLEDHTVEVSVTSEEIIENKDRIKETLENFGIKIDKIKATVGPTVTLYEIVPAPGVRVSKIKNLEDDIALSLSALGIRIIAPIPGKGTIGIEVPNKDKKIVSMSSVIKSAKFQESTYDLPIALGKTIQDETFVIDLAKMPHLLVAGATGQGKSVGLNAIITSLLYKKHPSELKLVLVDPKKVELTLYSKLEHHFLAKIPGEDDAIITDTHQVIYTLNSLCNEMNARYELLRMAEVRHMKEYNDKFRHRKLNPQKGHRFLPYIIVIIDEFADLIMTAGREIETPIARIAQLARAVGIHLVIATQRPTTNIITGVIKANFPARIAFRVSSMIDSRTIIDQPGANQLIGRGDMLISTGNELTRVQCAFVDTPEIDRITEFISNQRGYIGAYELPEYTPDSADQGGAAGGRANDFSQVDPMFDEVARFVVENQQGSTSSIQRRFSIGYNRAGRIMDQLEMTGIVGRAEGSKPREVLVQDLMSLEHLLAHMND